MARPIEQGDPFELDHGYPAADKGRREELQRLISWFHEQTEGATWHPSKRTVAKRRRRVAALTCVLGYQDWRLEARRAARQVANEIAYIDNSQPMRRSTVYINEDGGIGDMDTAEDSYNADEIFTEVPAALTTPGPDTMFGTDSLIDGVDTDDGTDHRDSPAQDGYLDRRANFLYHDLFLGQDRLVPAALAAPLSNIYTFAAWLFPRALLYGFNKVRLYEKSHEAIETWQDERGFERKRAVTYWHPPQPFETLLTTAFPHLRPLDGEAIRRIVRRRYDRTVVHRGKEYPLLGSTLLDETDPQYLLGLVYGLFPGTLEVAGEMVQLYCDLVNATRPRGEVPRFNDLPELHKPQAGKDGFPPYRTRIANVYAVTKNTISTALAFGVRVNDMHAYLKRSGLITASRRRRGTTPRKQSA